MENAPKTAKKWQKQEIMKGNKVYIINAYTKDGVLDHEVGEPYYNKAQAQGACETYQSVCVKTGFAYKVDEYDYDEWLNSGYGRHTDIRAY